MDVEEPRDAFTEEIFVAARPDRVFAALTVPEELLAWWGDPRQYWCTSWTSDLTVGGAWRSEGRSAAGHAFVVEGTFLEIDPPRALSFTWQASWTPDRPVLTVRITLEAKDGGTRVTWTMSGFHGHPQAFRDHRGGLPSILAWLEAYVAAHRLLRSQAQSSTRAR
jgi:uncharacterized protein YndB with AHSA1/START domain